MSALVEFSMQSRRALRRRKPRLRSSLSSPRLPDVSERVILDLVGLIYDAALRPPAWSIFLERYAEVVKGGCTSLFWYDFNDLRGSISYSVRADPSHVRKYGEYYCVLDVWAEGCKKIAKSGVVFAGQELCTTEEMIRTEFYNDFLRPMNVFYQAAGLISQTESAFGAISTLRPKAAGPYDREASLLRALMPHLQRAFQLHSRVLDLEGQVGAATDALDRLPTGVIFVDQEGRVLFANRAATTIVNQRDGLSISREGLTATRTSENNLLRQLIHGASTTSKRKGVHSGGMMLVSRPSMKRPFSVVVAPRPSSGFGLGPAHSAAIVIVSDPESEIEPEHAALCRLFGLTPAESTFAALIALGKSLEDVAGELSITRETARTHLKRIFDKTSTHRQGELVRLLLTAVPQIHL